MKKFEQEFDYIKINIASPARIRQWGARTLPNGQVVGEVIKPETINYRTFKPEMGGLFCEKIFGPVKNWECYCGKYKRVQPNELLICERCGVEITESRVRRHRMGYIELNTPVTHVWYLKGVPSYLSLLLRRKLKTLEEIIYFNKYLVLNAENFTDVANNIQNNTNFENFLSTFSNNEISNISYQTLKCLYLAELSPMSVYNNSDNTQFVLYRHTAVRTLSFYNGPALF